MLLHNTDNVQLLHYDMQGKFNYYLILLLQKFIYEFQVFISNIHWLSKPLECLHYC